MRNGAEEVGSAQPRAVPPRPQRALYVPFLKAKKLPICRCSKLRKLRFKDAKARGLTTPLSQLGRAVEVNRVLPRSMSPFWSEADKVIIAARSAFRGKADL